LGQGNENKPENITAEEVKKLKDEIEALKSENSQLQDSITEKDATIATLDKLNTDLMHELTVKEKQAVIPSGKKPKFTFNKITYSIVVPYLMYQQKRYSAEEVVKNKSIQEFLIGIKSGLIIKEEK